MLLVLGTGDYLESNEFYKKLIYTGKLMNLSVHFTLHTDPRAEVPEFTISCHTYGGPATTVIWTLNDSLSSVDGNTSQVILDTSYKSVFDSRL